MNAISNLKQAMQKAERASTAVKQANQLIIDIRATVEDEDLVKMLWELKQLNDIAMANL